LTVRLTLEQARRGMLVAQGLVKPFDTVEATVTAEAGLCCE
jgi:hypothetical protein